jgi:hypothetical protein
LEQQIDKDLNRLFPEYSFFRKTAVGDILREVLIIWSRDHVEGYKQGIPELCAVLYYVFSSSSYLYNEKKGNVANKKSGFTHADMFSMLCDPSYLAHDVYAGFEFVF